MDTLFLRFHLPPYTRISSYYESPQLKAVFLDFETFRRFETIKIDDGQPMASCMAFWPLSSAVSWLSYSAVSLISFSVSQIFCISVFRALSFSNTQRWPLNLLAVQPLRSLIYYLQKVLSFDKASNSSLLFYCLNILRSSLLIDLDFETSNIQIG